MAIEECFGRPIHFGTSGIRGIMRPGTNGVNVYTIRHVTQGLADFIRGCGEEIGGGVVIACDSRNNSEEYAQETAMVLAANGIHVYLFESLRPTPELSYAVRETGSIAGVNITASHNTKEYNGYKVYWSDGGQLPPHHAAKVWRSIEKSHIFDDVKTMRLETAKEQGLITMLGEETDEKYMECVLAQSEGRAYIEQAGRDFAMIYTPFHGAGYRIVPEVLKRLGVKNILTVYEQMSPNGDFPTVKSPNPEYIAGFDLAIEKAMANDIDLIVGTDPDCDRCGVVIRAKDGFRALSGNQVGVLLLDYLITMKKEKGTLKQNAAAVKSIVSTNMANVICRENGVYLFETLNGFKFIGEKIKEFEETGEYDFLFGFEESYGYLSGTYTRDKDAALATMLVAEMAAWYRTKGMDLNDALSEMYKKYGYYTGDSLYIWFDGPDTEGQMAKTMKAIRKDSPSDFGMKIVRVHDYLFTEPKSDILYYEMENDCTVIIRPSGTEPKIKIYIMTKGRNRKRALSRSRVLSKAVMKYMDRIGERLAEQE